MIEWSLVIDEGVAVWTATNGERRVRIYDYGGFGVFIEGFVALELVGMSDFSSVSAAKDYAIWWLKGVE